MSNAESDKESEYGHANSVMVFITHIKESSNYELLDDNEDFSEDELFDDAFAEAYKAMYLKWIEKL